MLRSPAVRDLVYRLAKQALEKPMEYWVRFAKFRRE
jgi:hypothetical protein